MVFFQCWQLSLLLAKRSTTELHPLLQKKDFYPLRQRQDGKAIQVVEIQAIKAGGFM